MPPQKAIGFTSFYPSCGLHCFQIDALNRNKAAPNTQTAAVTSIQNFKELIARSFPHIIFNRLLWYLHAGRVAARRTLDPQSFCLVDPLSCWGAQLFGA